MAQLSKFRVMALGCAASLALAPVTAVQADNAADNNKDKPSVSSQDVSPPIAKKVPHSYTHHGITIEDP